MTEKHNFGINPVTCHAWNRDRSGLCLSLNSSDVKIFKKDGNGWSETASLNEHGQRVLGIDWAPNNNWIVTCGADRNAYVWTLVKGKWKPTSLVLLRIERAATFVRVSPKENKFAVGSGARLVAVCYYEEENDFWVSKHIKKQIRSTVTSLDWHPNNILLATGSTDFKARVFSAYVKDVEEKPSPTCWGTKMVYGNMMGEFSNEQGGGWVHSVSFSPSGDKLAWTAHDSSVSVVDARKGLQLSVVRGNFLPFLSLTWVTENSLVAVGYDCLPKLFTQDHQGKLAFVTDLDKSNKKETQHKTALQKFRDFDKCNTGSDSSNDLQTEHQNTISQVVIHSGGKDKCTKFSTASADGNIIIWDFKSLERSIDGLKVT